MKRLLTAIFVLALIGVSINSCKKDEATASGNSVTITGTFTVGDKTFTDPTFDLGTPEQHYGYTYYNTKPPVATAIQIGSGENDIDLGENVFLYYYMDIYSAAPGTAIETYSYFEVYLDTPAKSTSLSIYSYDALATVTKVDEIGGYIEGTYEGDYYYDKKNETAPFHLRACLNFINHHSNGSHEYPAFA